MNYYIDFDNTLYNTPLLTQKMLNSIVNFIKRKNNLNFDDLYKECKSMFSKDNIYNIYDLAIYFSNKYNLDYSIIIDNLNNIILNASDLVYNDATPFLNKIKEKKHNLYLLTYCKDSLEYQSLKVAGSRLSDFFDALYITSIPKYNLNIDYTNGIFIDDNPEDLLGLYKKNPKQLIRLRRKENKYSIKNLDNSNIQEISTLNDIII